MKALSLWQPWATLLINGWKRIETRGWGTSEREWIAIAATATLPPEGRRALEKDAFQEALFHCTKRAGGYGLRPKVRPDELPYGAILGVARLGDCREMTEERIAQRRELEPMEYAFGDYEPGRFEWHIDRVTQFIEPIPCKGHQKLWTVRGRVGEELEGRLVKAAMSPEEAARLALPSEQLALPSSSKGQW